MSDSEKNKELKPDGGAEPEKCSEQEVQDCISVMERLLADLPQLVSLPYEQRLALMRAAGQLSRPDREESRRRTRALKKEKRKQKLAAERKARSLTGIRLARSETIYNAPEQITHETPENLESIGQLNSPRNCYVCKAEYTQFHFFYDAMCKKCGDFNYAKRFQTAPLDGQVALITGSRLKIGYQATLLMLRAGARVIATTRFPVDSALRYSKEKDFDKWSDRLHIHGLDLRHTPSVEIFCRYVEQNYERLDILINNAAQTVRRPPGFYAHLMENERQGIANLPEGARKLLNRYESCKEQLLLDAVPNMQKEAAIPVTWTGKVPGVGIRASAELSQIPYTFDHSLKSKEVFPVGQLDADLQQVDLRETNSWRLRLGEIETSEMFELQLVNAIAPFVLCNKLAPFMQRENTGQKHIVNVTAMEGKFHRFHKIDRHPHTNMAKAALNMLTHTSASTLAKHGIYMNAVDTGWVTDEDPMLLSQEKQEVHDFQPPLDIVDGAARVCDPFFDGIITGKHWCGKFLKDYFPTDW